MPHTVRPGHTVELGFQTMKLGKNKSLPRPGHRLNSWSTGAHVTQRQSHQAALLKPTINQGVKMSFTQESAAFTGHATGDWLTPTPAFPGH